MRGEILFLCHRIPFPPDRGDKIRSYHLLKRLAEVAPVHVGCFADDARDMGYAEDMAALTASQCVLMRDRSRMMAGLSGLVRGQPLLVSLFDHPDLHRWTARALAERPIAAVVAYSAQMAHFVPALPDGVRFLMDFVDFDSAKYAAYGAEGSGPMAWINRREGRVLLDFEKSVAARADICAFVSETEAALFRQASGQGLGKVIAIENGVALDMFDPSADFPPVEHGEGPLLVFTGQMDYRPNVEAVESFARETFPAIRAVHPQARFAIVGRKPAKTVQALADLPGIVVTGAVPDVRGWLAAADVVVAPLRIARGIQNKVLEAMAMARPVVASPQAAEGIDAQDETHFLIAANPDEEAAKIIALLADAAKAAGLAQAARARMEERYRWSATLSAVPELLFGVRDRDARAA
ncbi:sugar transferase (PEP-CTERM/EpsH1 system associated) [Sphingobium wenxiniae]|uniref:Sugar transferase (PEP-CTERM/EpsH1 system associated) n=1 Tax=Sphingobium wenxiniae (strain DSM 21828 / CGMCC 1.7748 / JZ-1) TaxID=595605 RepID=A0A562KR53_SPHWJ|nr:TIGR03087 family PEP-CTERM/XrtA system glycosyltransferase [Sphingobium wenxiniae]MBB6190002.1 sugar transferase (PEP-CTERM/EpsH1 system associated) [Sphingobium wenxiniae]TWH97683.1 sugar transferase (PEP-CTERM/EpsH1 system associated) [Sphingobium wenxiniae]